MTLKLFQLPDLPDFPEQEIPSVEDFLSEDPEQNRNTITTLHGLVTQQELTKRSMHNLTCHLHARLKLALWALLVADAMLGFFAALSIVLMFHQK